MSATHLPIATTFCTAEVHVGQALTLWIDGNSKVTRGNGTYDNPKPNAFSLPAASVAHAYASPAPRACPGSTPTCRASCYVKGLAQHAPEVYARYEQNAEVLAACLRSEALFYDSAEALADWIVLHAEYGFRWHVSGDVWNEQHAHWIATVCGFASHVPFWIYTRTFNVVPVLVAVDNLAVNISADVDNYPEARAVALSHGARVCYLTEDGALPADLPAGSVIFPDYALRGRGLDTPTAAPWWQGLSAEHRRMTCPTDFFSQSEAHRCGPCRKCF